METLEKLHVKTITLALVLAAVLCWPVLHITQVAPRDRDILRLEKSLAEAKGELNALSKSALNEVQPYKEQLMLLAERKVLVETENSLLKEKLDHYKKAYDALSMKSLKLEKAVDIMQEIRNLQSKKDEIEQSISHHQGGANQKYVAQLERRADELQKRIIGLQEIFASNNSMQPNASSWAD